MRVLIHPVDSKTLDGCEFKSVSSGSVRRGPHQLLNVANRSCLMSCGVVSREIWLRVSASDNGSTGTGSPNSDWYGWAWNSSLNQEPGELEAFVASQRHENRLATLVCNEIRCHDKSDWEGRGLTRWWRISMLWQHRHAKSCKYVENLKGVKFETWFHATLRYFNYFFSWRNILNWYTWSHCQHQSKNEHFWLHFYWELLLSPNWMN